MFAGQPDPADDSHFSVRCTFGSRIEWIDVYVEDGGDLRMVVRQDDGNGGPRIRLRHLKESK